MLPFRLGFDHPNYLFLMAALPIFWWIGFGSLGVLGPIRRALALLLRSVVWTGLVFAIAGVQLVWISDKVTVIYLLDQSESIPAAKRQVMLDYVVRNVEQHRDRDRQDRAGLIAFGRDASIQIPPFDDSIYLRRLEGQLGRTDATNLEAALNLAQAAMPEDSSGRIVVVTDGNENLGQARKLAARLADAGIGIDVVPVELSASNEVLVEKVDLPSEIRKGTPFEMRVVISNETDAGSGGPVRGRLRVRQTVGNTDTLLMDQPVTLKPGKNVLPLRHRIERPSSYTYRAEFTADSPGDDAIGQNNVATAYTYVRGKGRVLLIEDVARRGDFDLFAQTLMDANIEVVTMGNDALFGSLADLQAFDAVILAGVPRVAGGADGIASFSDAQISMLVRNTQQLGAGLLMIGGPEALGAGGWIGTELEQAMPVDFQIRNTKIQAVGALALIMHAGEMAQGNYWQKVVAKASIEQLGSADYAGVLHWQMKGERWMWGGRNGLLPVGPNRKAMLAALGRMSPGDMPQFDPGMKMAVASLKKNPAAVKHCIIISDGDPSAPFPATIQAFKDANISVSTVAVESHGQTGSQLMRRIASQTGGKYYAVKSGKALPKIYQREARRISRPLVLEPEGGAVPEVIFPHECLDGIDRILPPISGLVLTQTKDSPLARVLVQSPKPDAPENATVLAVWPYGLGRTAVLTTDTGARWTQSWTRWDGYDKFHSQLVRWLMRPTGDTGKFSIATQVEDGRVEVVVSAMSTDDSFLNFLNMNASVIGPDLQPIGLQMRQAAPGRYVGNFDADAAGSYFVNVLPGPNTAPLSTGVTVPYSDEFRIRKTNQALITALASVDPRGGEPGRVTPPLGDRISPDLVAANAFRPGLAWARSIKDAWPWFVLAACLVFLLDVFVRRVAISFAWIAPLVARLRGQPAAAENVTLNRLDSLIRQKTNARESRQDQFAGSRFDPEMTVAAKGENAGDASEFSGGGGGGASPNPSGRSAEAKGGGIRESDGPGASYTERLLEAKRRAKK